MFDLLGQEFALDVFQKSYKKGRISHAYIIAGPDGIGKSVFAMHIAASLLCLGDKKPCGVCNQCIKVMKGNHADIKIISNKGRSIGVDEIRQVIGEVYTKPYEGLRKLIIIKNADEITVQGQNAILKTLEEPSKDTTIIMTVENSNLLLETILSRCQIFKLSRVSMDRIRDYLISKGVDEKRASTAASLSDGITGNALKFLEDKFLKLREEVIGILIKVVKGSSIEALESVEFFLNNKDNIDSILDIIISWFRDIMVLKHTIDKNVLINKDYYELLVEESQQLSYNKLNGIIDSVNSTREKIRLNANFQLAMEVMLLNIQEVII